MPRYFFHLVSPDGFLRDEVGSEFASVGDAWLSAFQAAVEMSCDFIRQHVDPRAYQFEIADGEGRFLIDLPFSEITGGASQRPGLHDQLKTRMARCRELRTELHAEFANTRNALAATRAALDRSQSQRR